MDQVRVEIAPHTHKRLRVTLRKPAWPVPEPDIPYVLAEAADGSGVAVAVFGPDTEASLADAEHAVALWNTALDAREAAATGKAVDARTSSSTPLGAMALRAAMTSEGWNSHDELTRYGWRNGFGYSIWFKRNDWHGQSALALTGKFAVFHAHVPDVGRADDAVHEAAALARRAWAEFPDCPPQQGCAGELIAQGPFSP